MAQAAIFAPPPGTLPDTPAPSAFALARPDNPRPSRPAEPTAPPLAAVPIIADPPPAEAPTAPAVEASTTPSRRADDPDTAAADDSLVDAPTLPKLPRAAPRHRWRPALAALALLAVGGGTIAWWLRPEPTVTLPGLVTGPRLTVFAPIDGRITRVMATPGARIAPGTELFELQPRPADPRIQADLSARLDLARQRGIRLDLRLRELAGLLARNRVTGTDPVAAREAEAMRQRSRDLEDEIRANAGEVSMLERGLAADASLNAGAALDTGGQKLLVKATQTALVARVAVIAGMEVVPGLPLAEIVDCDHLSVTADGAAAAALGIVAGRTLRVTSAGAGTGVELRVPDVAARDASPGRLSMPMDRALLERATGSACPVGSDVSLQVR
jgi:multidrug resistance efflux pump